MRILHLLNWNLNNIESYLDSIKEAGFDAIQINPMQPFKKEKEFNWWSSYQPLDFKIGNEFGSRDDLKRLCEKAKEKNIDIVVDIVCNHTANNGGDFENQIKPSFEVADRIKNHPEYFKKHSKVYNFDSWSDVVNESIGLPGLNLRNKEIQDIVFDYLEDLKDCGVKGFRIDAAKHIGLPSDGCDFFERLSKFKKDYNLKIYGEFIGEEKDKKEELSKYIDVLTNDPNSIVDKNKVVVNAESHDDVLNIKDNVTSDYGKVIDNYKNLTKEYSNTLFYMRDFYKPYNPFGRQLNLDNPKRNNYSYIDIVLNDRELKEANNQKPVYIDKNIKVNNELHSQLCCDVHDKIFDNIKIKNYSKDEVVLLALIDYEIQMTLNDKLNIYKGKNYDEFLTDCIMNVLYKNYSHYNPLNNISYEDFYTKMLTTYPNYFDGTEYQVNNDDISKINTKIKKLNNQVR